MSDRATQFIVNKTDLRQGKFVTEALPELQPGEILLAIDEFAFTANNITYAELGSSLGYWQFYPTQEDGWGNIPVWGCADVIASKHDAIRVGERIYGYLPMASHAIFRPDRITDRSFLETSPHRQKLPPTYNLYVRCAGDPSWRADEEAYYSLLRPLFVTSFMIDDFLADKNFFGVSSVLLSSASSKTAFGLAYLLHRRNVVEVVGLTSPGNRDFVQGLGCYDRATLYGEIGGLDRLPAMLVDFAGSTAIRTAVHEHYREDLKYSCSVGMSHRGFNPAATADKSLPGAAPVFFFVPDHLRRRGGEWGREGLAERLDNAWADFMPTLRQWLTVAHGNRADIEKIYRATLDGKVKPDEGHILSLKE